MLGSDFRSLARVGVPIVAILAFSIPATIGFWKSSWLWFFGSLLVWLLVLNGLYRLDEHFGWTRDVTRRVFGPRDECE